MENKKHLSSNDTFNFNVTYLEFYQLFSKLYPTIKEVCTEIVNLEAILNLPKGTEHFMSDIHGEYDAFKHILNNGSGVIKEKIKEYLSDALTKEEIEELATLIYYPNEKIKKVKEVGLLNKEWYTATIENLIILIKKLSLKYTRSKVRKAIPKEYMYIIEEAINERDSTSESQRQYHNQIIETIISIHTADEFIIMLTTLIKRLAVDRLHIIGDIYDRGERPDKILDLLMNHHNVDIQWGNHDILWMGAACGNKACIARVVRNCLVYKTTQVLENRYAISLRLLERYAKEKYPSLTRKEAMVQCISIILIKLEGILIKKHPEYEMDEQLLLDKVKNNEIEINNTIYKVNHLDKEDCNYQLDDKELQIVTKLKEEFIDSERLHEHVNFLYTNGSMYLCCNNNLLYHGCMPLDNKGYFSGITINGYLYKGKELFDYCDKQARSAYFRKDKKAIDFMFYLWTGYYSPLSGRELKSFERMFISDETSWTEKQNDYYQYYHEEDICNMILKDFDISINHGHIINGHTPIKSSENPVRANGKVIVIDGGFCKNYQKHTGIAGYTLISTSYGLDIKAHTPFMGIDRVLEINSDIYSTKESIEVYKARMLVKDTDIGKDIIEKTMHLKILLYAYRDGIIISD
jgi:fructose-1,6-bisphosphatase-3